MLKSIVRITPHRLCVTGDFSTSQTSRRLNDWTTHCHRRRIKWKLSVQTVLTDCTFFSWHPVYQSFAIFCHYQCNFSDTFVAPVVVTSTVTRWKTESAEYLACSWFLSLTLEIHWVAKSVGQVQGYLELTCCELTLSLWFGKREAVEDATKSLLQEHSNCRRHP